MEQQIGYALKMAWRYRRDLVHYQRDPILSRVCITELRPEALKAEGIEVIVLDFDGVLSAYGEVMIYPAVAEWLKHCVRVFEPGNIFILSNKPTQGRQAYLAKNFPEVTLLLVEKRKPDPNGLLHILSLKKIEPNALLMVDDRLLTGILAAVIAKTQARYITKPFVSLRKKPIQELFFMTLRALERLIF